jgi:hypothetical protein
MLNQFCNHRFVFESFMPAGSVEPHIKNPRVFPFWLLDHGLQKIIADFFTYVLLFLFQHFLDIRSEVVCTQNRVLVYVTFLNYFENAGGLQRILGISIVKRWLELVDDRVQLQALILGALNLRVLLPQCKSWDIFKECLYLCSIYARNCVKY